VAAPAASIASTFDGAIDANVSYVAGKLNQAGSFNGTTSAITTQQNGPLGTSSWSVSVWVYLTDTTSLRRIIAWGSTPVPGQIFLEVSSTTARVSIGSAYGAQKTISANTWQHLVATYDGTTSRLYLNGGTPNEVVLATATTAGVILIGYASVYIWIGMIDEVAMYDRALTSTDVSALYAYGIGTPSLEGGLATGLIHHWPLDGSSTDLIGRASLTIGALNARTSAVCADPIPSRCR
jgi:Concanavalin A-like lectin/glucanases superfamily